MFKEPKSFAELPMVLMNSSNVKEYLEGRRVRGNSSAASHLPVLFGGDMKKQRARIVYFGGWDYFFY